MDAAVAAAMSDPERNPHFRRRWAEAEVVPCGTSSVSSPTIGTLGLALQAAMNRRRRVEQERAGITDKGDPPR